MTKSEANSRSAWLWSPCPGLFCNPDFPNQVLENYPSKRLSKICLPIKVPPKSEAGPVECQEGLRSLTISTCSWDGGSHTTISAGTVCCAPASGSGECLPGNTPVFSAKWLKENLSSWSLLSSGQASFPGRGTPPLIPGTTQRGSGRAGDKVIPRPNTTAVSTDQQ